MWMLPVACGEPEVPAAADPVSPAWGAAYGAITALEPQVQPGDLAELCDPRGCRYRVPLAAPVAEDGFASELSTLLDDGPWHVTGVRVVLNADGGALAEFGLTPDNP
jgi:hypothetical protein